MYKEGVMVPSMEKNNGVYEGINNLLGKIVEIPLGSGTTTARVVNGEDVFNEPSISAGFVHFADPRTGSRITFAGISWTLKNARVVSE